MHSSRFKSRFVSQVHFVFKRRFGLAVEPSKAMPVEKRTVSEFIAHEEISNGGPAIKQQKVISMLDKQTPPGTKIDPSELREMGIATVELLEKHFKGLRDCPARPEHGNLKPGDLAKKFTSQAPEDPAPDFHKILKDVEGKVLPGVVHWQHPRFMAYYPSSSSLPAMLSETLIAGIGAVGLQWSSNPIATELEVVVMDWIAQMIGMGGDFLHTSGKGGGILQNTAGEAMVVVTVAARIQKQRELLAAKPPDQRMVDEDLDEAAYYADSSRLVVYMSDQTHYCGPKACRVAGLRCRKVPARLVNNNFELFPEDVAEAIAADRAKGLIPCIMWLNHGTTNTCGADVQVEGFGELCKREGMWLHIDAAYAGPSWALPEFRHYGEAAAKHVDSLNLNGSKWFLCGFDSAFLYVRDRQKLVSTFSATDVFMAKSDESIYNPELKNWAVPLGRRFRALRIWAVIEYFGVSGIRAYLRQAIEQADWLRAKIDSMPELLEQPIRNKLGLVCFRIKGDDSLTESLSKACLDAGFVVYPSKLEGKSIVRVALGGPATECQDLEALWKIVLEQLPSSPATQ
jgi:glutamate/tyrosine decarboxylase-like PLP-dependent enzyme